MKNLFRKTVLYLLLILSITALSNKAGDDKNYDVKLQILNDKNNKINNFLVRVVSSEKDKNQGLMWVKKLPSNYGMLFQFDKEQIVQMWMKNTEIPLDMIFIDKNNRIVHIKQNASPQSLEIISSLYLVNQVLEINGGMVEKLGIEVGNRIIY